jgi:hypothetical protein
MPKVRKTEPDATVTSLHESARLKTVQEYDAKYPEYSHFWAPMNMEARAVKGLGAEKAPGRDGDDEVQNRMSVLLRRKRELRDKIVGRQAAFSRDTFKATLSDEQGGIDTSEARGGYDKPTAQFASFKSPNRE